VTLPISIHLGNPAPVLYRGWRCLHNAEGGYMSDPSGMPCVRPSANAPSIEFTHAMQLLSWALVKRNPNVTPHKWKVIHADTTAITNGNGYFNDNDPRRDYVNGEDLDAEKNPRLMKAIIFAGMFGRWDRIGDELIGVPGIHGIDARRPMPSVDEVIAKHWYYAATTGTATTVAHFPQGGGQAVLLPYFLIEPVSYPLAWFERWEREYLPDPLTFYR
jgi:hypothetical protein